MGIFKRIWSKGILGCFLTGLFVILPVAITITVIGWVVEKLGGIMGPGTFMGDLMTRWGGALLQGKHGNIAFWLGIGLTLVGIWLLGVLFKLLAKHQIDNVFNALLDKIPIFNTIYRPISQIFNLLKKDDGSEMKGMSTVFCSFGAENGAQVLGLLATKDTFLLNGTKNVLVYIPTSPVPMSGALCFVPAQAVTPAPDMSVDDLMKIYFSLGTLSSQVIPERFKETGVT